MRIHSLTLIIIGLLILFFIYYIFKIYIYIFICINDILDHRQNWIISFLPFMAHRCISWRRHLSQWRGRKKTFEFEANSIIINICVWPRDTWWFGNNNHHSLFNIPKCINIDDKKKERKIPMDDRLEVPAAYLLL